ncbi:MAG: hypothetical protein DRJ96_07565 [Thermoprotei archaeon]|nr:MAG: hypothetical protein DRJ96_07565 [Thermoprotei archaeon]
MRALELALMVVVVALLYATLSAVSVMPKLSLRNDYFLLREEARSVAAILAESRALPKLRDPELLRTVVGALAPPNREFRVEVVDVVRNWTLTVETPNFGDCTLAATGVAMYSDPRSSSIYVVRVTLGRITGG